MVGSLRQNSKRFPLDQKKRKTDVLRLNAAPSSGEIHDSLGGRYLSIAWERLDTLVVVGRRKKGGFRAHGMGWLCIVSLAVRDEGTSYKSAFGVAARG